MNILFINDLWDRMTDYTQCGENCAFSRNAGAS